MNKNNSIKNAKILLISLILFLVVDVGPRTEPIYNYIKNENITLFIVGILLLISFILIFSLIYSWISKKTLSTYQIITRITVINILIDLITGINIIFMSILILNIVWFKKKSKIL